MSAPSSERKKFHRSMSTDELVVWLRQEGLGHKDCEQLKDERFTAQSFLLLSEDFKELEIGVGGKLLLKNLMKEVKENLAGPPSEDNPAPSDDTPDSTEDDPDVMRDKEETPPTHPFFKIPLNMLPLCTGPPYDFDDVDGKASYQSAGAAAFIYHNKLWSGRQVLKVFFMNPEVLEKWRCEGKKKMTTEMILGWASVWEEAPSAPKFVATDNKRKADIRISFSDTGGCWSMVGMEAESKAKASNPTMTLNLSNPEYPEFFLRHLVIHEFGHALGLEHEHQRSEFWDNVKDFLDIDKMKSDPRFGHLKKKAKETYFGMDWLEKKETKMKEEYKSDYDSKSIMHYWFAVEWLKDRQYHNHKNIRSDSRLTDKQKKCLLGIHDRNNNCAKHPSPNDFRVLEEAYGARK